MPVLTVQIGQAALVGNRRQASSPWAHTFQDASSDVDMGSLYLSIDGVNNESAGTIARELARHYFESASQTAEAALLRSVRQAYRYLYDARLEDSLFDIGMTAVVVRDGRASIAQVLPTQFYLVQEEQITALPETQERLAGQESLSQQEGRYPQWEPPIEMFRATLDVQDVAVLCTKNIGAVLSDEEIQTTLVGSKVQSAAESLVDSARKRGESNASALVLRFAIAKETATSLRTSLGESSEDTPDPPSEPRIQPKENVASSILGVILAVGVLGWSLLASLFRPRSQPAGAPAGVPSSVATQSTIVTRTAADQARRQRLNRVAAGGIVLVVLVLLVIGANALFGGDDRSASVTDDLDATSQPQEAATPSQSGTTVSTPSTAQVGTASPTPAPPPEPAPGSLYINELQVLVNFDAGQQPGDIYGLSNSMYVLDQSSGAVYRIETSGQNEVVYQPGSEGLAGSAAVFVTGRADVIQILDRDNRLYFAANGEAPQAAQLPTGSIQEPRASATYDQNFYLLDAGSSELLRFRPVGSGVYGEPEGYFGINSGVDLAQATDLAIDGSVFILFQDGTINRYDSGARTELSIDATVPSPLGIPSAIFISQGMGSLYILDGDNDRVVQVTTEGLYQRQLLAPNRLFATATNLFINRGETYLWVVSPTGVTRIPLPSLPDDAPRSPA